MKIITTVTLIAIAFGATPAIVEAQEGQIEEIIVTSTRREQSLQDVTTAVTVFTGDDLSNLRILEPRDLAEQTPGLLTKFGPNGLATVGFYIRGVGINDFTGTVDPSVGIYVDEVFKPTPDMLNFAVFDIERVEVLKGPQGTLYGRNSTAGAINFITVKPTEEFEGFIRAGYSSFATSDVTGAVSGPLSDTLQGRLSAKGQLSSSDSGYAFNRTTNNTLGKNNQFAVRSQLSWLPREDFSLRLSYTYGVHDSEQPLLQHVGARDAVDPGLICASIIAGRIDEGACVDFLGYFDPDDDPYAGDANVDPVLHIDSHEITATINWDLSRFTVTAISGYEDFSKRQSQDIDASPNVVADNFTFNDVENFSQEIRLTSDDSFPFNWILGGNYGNTKVNWFQTIDLSDLAIPTSNGADQTTKTWALFAHATMKLTEKFELEGGLRFSNEKREWTGATFIGTFTDLASAFASGAPTLSILPLPVGDPRLGGPLDFDNSIEENNVDFQVSLKYKPNEDTMFYLRISEAFRSGGFSSAVIFSQEALEPFAPENLLAYEGGFKLSLADNRIRFNGSAFFYDFEGFQATFVRATEASARLQNAGDVEIIGFEASLDWIPTTGLAVNIGISVLDTKIVATNVVLPQLDGSSDTTIKGNEIPNAPSFSLNGRVQYEVPVGSQYVATFQTDFNYVGSHFLEPNNREALSEDGYFLLNGRVTLAPENAQWHVSTWVRNLTNEVYRSAAQDLIFALGFAEIAFGHPRTWGIEVGRRF